jgi:hypothetical protein
MITYDRPHHQRYPATDLGVFSKSDSANWSKLDTKIIGGGETSAATIGRRFSRLPWNSPRPKQNGCKGT